MSINKVAEGIYKLSANIEEMLFEGIWEMPNGVNLNSYIVKGEKTAIIDGVCDWDGVPETFFGLLEEMDVDIQTVEYVIINHMEPDHSGWIDELKHLRPDIKIYCSMAASRLLEAFYGKVENITIVRNGDVLDLGGRELQFISTPNVHWPDTIMTIDSLTKTVFSCDMFGSFGIIQPHKGFDDELTELELDDFVEDTLRYYSNILANFSSFVLKAIDKLRLIDPKIIAPGHGIVWRKNPERIINHYETLAKYQTGLAKREITILWSSMYGMTEKAVNYIEDRLKEKKIKVKAHNIMENSWGTMLTSAWESTGYILAMPTYEFKMFPPMAGLIEELHKKGYKDRIVFRLGSYGWSGGAEKDLKEILTRNNSTWELLESVEFKGAAVQEDFDLINQRLDELVEKIDLKLN